MGTCFIAIGLLVILRSILGFNQTVLCKLGFNMHYEVEKVLNYRQRRVYMESLRACAALKFQFTGF